MPSLSSGGGPERTCAVGEAELGAHAVHDPTREAPGSKDGAGDSGGEVVSRVLLPDRTPVRHDDGRLIELPGDQVHPGLVQDFGHRRFGQGLLARGPSGEERAEVRLDVTPVQITRDTEAQVVPAQDPAVCGEQGFPREVLRFEVLRRHLPADGMVAEHEPVEFGERQPPGVVGAAEGALQLLAAPDLDLHRVEAGVEQHVLPEAQSRLQVRGEGVQGGGRASARRSERELQCVLIDLFVDRIRVQFHGSTEAKH